MEAYEYVAPLTLDEYQVSAQETAIYDRDYAVIYPALGLTGEAGEVAEKVKKALRDGTFDPEAVAKELGDVLWYLANLAGDLGFTLEDIAVMNLNKLNSRAQRGTIQGNGDDR